MPRALLALFCLLASLAHAAPNSILHRPYDLDTGHGVLRGSLLLPRSAVPPPVVLLVAGSGPTDRDGNNPFGGNNRYLLRLAEALAERGIASVLRQAGSRPQPGGGAARGRPQRRRLCRRRGRLERAAGPRPALLPADPGRP
ncbi:hypothetical protein HMPREF3150_05607 [Pseudomonas aeruginosa]|nr:hypothetical protein HMPREF3150_05607 [Pseudomonas aeruginosa]